MMEPTNNLAPKYQYLSLCLHFLSVIAKIANTIPSNDNNAVVILSTFNSSVKFSMLFFVVMLRILCFAYFTNVKIIIKLLPIDSVGFSKGNS